MLPALGILLDDLIIPLVDAIGDDLAPLLAETLPGAIKNTVAALQGVGDLIQGILEAIQRLDAWTAEHLAPPEARGYLGRARTAGYTESYMGQDPGGRWAQRVDINVYGLPGFEEYVRQAVGQADLHTVGSIGGP